MTKTCEVCRHWYPARGTARVSDVSTGECRAGPPARDFIWPRTKAIDTCGQYNPPPAPSPTAQATPPQAELALAGAKRSGKGKVAP